MTNPGDATVVSADAPNQTGALHDSAFPPSPTASPVPESLRRFFNECVADRDVELPPRIPGYIVLRAIGRGATGQVFEAFHIELRRSVAIKVLRPSLIDDSSRHTRFRAECAAAARISHPNIVEVHDCGVVDGSPFRVATPLATFYNLADGRNGIAIANPVPEPSTIALVSLTACGWLARRYVKRKSK